MLTINNVFQFVAQWGGTIPTFQPRTCGQLTLNFHLDQETIQQILKTCKNVRDQLGLNPSAESRALISISQQGRNIDQILSTIVVYVWVFWVRFSSPFPAKQLRRDVGAVCSKETERIGNKFYMFSYTRGYYNNQDLMSQLVKKVTVEKESINKRRTRFVNASVRYKGTLCQSIRKWQFECLK